MATIADKLTTIAGIKTDIRTAINGKGGSLTSGSPFSAYSAAISSLPSGGGGGASSTDWSQIGYTGAPQPVQAGFSYAKTIYDNWDPTVTNLREKFKNDTSLVYMPLVDTSSATSMESMFFNCSGLTLIPELNSSGVTDMRNMLDGCSSLQKITSLDMSNCTSLSGMFGNPWTTTSNPTNLRFMLLKGIGTPSGTTSYSSSRMEKCSNWGVADSTYTDARQSLVDSLLTYSFDRATAGYDTCTIKLSSDSYNQLTSQELADIQAKGYDITT